MSWFLVSVRTEAPNRRSRRDCGTRPLRKPGKAVVSVSAPMDSRSLSSTTDAGIVMTRRLRAGPAFSILTSLAVASAVAVAGDMMELSDQAEETAFFRELGTPKDTTAGGGNQPSGHGLKVNP